MKRKLVFSTSIIAATALGIIFLYQSRWIERLFRLAFAPVFGKVWQAEVQKFRSLYPIDSAQLIFLGDSHAEQCEWHELLSEWRCANRGIGGETTDGLLNRLDCLPENGAQKTIFLQTGVNDLIAGKPVSEVLEQYRKILDYLSSAGYRVVPTLIFPVRYLNGVNEKLPELNEGISNIAMRKGMKFINLNPIILKDGKLGSEYSYDGVHLNAEGYRLWLKEIREYLSHSEDSGSR
jgi:lysophospholipase L1-like esterase